MKTKSALWTLLFTGILFSFIVLSISCQKEDKQEPKPIVFNNTGSIDSKGGTVKTSDGASVVVPEGALSNNQIISITNLPSADSVKNMGYKVYNLKPDGLTFSDSIIITLPFDDTYLDRNSQDKNFGVGIMVFQDSKWIKLKTEIDLINKTAKAKTIHFSTYVVYFPGIMAIYYYQNKSISSGPIMVPHYFQGNLGWCGYYSLSMLTRYAGYPYKAPYFAAFFKEEPTETSGLEYFELMQLNQKLNKIGIEIEVASEELPYFGWMGIDDLRGYILKQNNDGFPVMICASIQHAFVVAGHDQTGFFINDPSGAFVDKIIPNNTRANLAMVHISYDQFATGIHNWRDYVLNWGADYTLVVKSSLDHNNKKVTINFPSGFSTLFISDKNGSLVGTLEIDGKYQPNGYSLINGKSLDENFDGSNFITLTPIISNSDINNSVKANLNYIIDGKDVKGSPIVTDDIGKLNSYYQPKTIKFQLSNLSKGNHTLIVKLSSINDPNIIYDNWEFPFGITNEFIDNGLAPLQPSSPSPAINATAIPISTTISWACSDPENDPLTYDVYLDTNNPPTTKVSPEQTSKSYLPVGLIDGKEYYWQIIAKDNKGNSTTGPVWKFTTEKLTIIDIDGNSYKTIQIGNQTWMAENLKTTKYRNGDKIELVTDPSRWWSLATGAYCWYDNNIANKDIYGALYNWYAVGDSRNIAPTGWHVASDAEWRKLITYLGGENIAGGKLKETGSNHWLNPNIGATNSSGFTALPGGNRNNDGSFSKVGNFGYWWSSTAFDALNAWGWDIVYNIPAVLSLNGATKRYGFSVRCIKD